MKIVASLFRFRLPLKRPLAIKSETILHRKGLLLKLEDETGSAGWGEVSPLPGFSGESLMQAEESLDFLLPRFTRKTFPDDFSSFARQLQSIGGKKLLFPSVRFGLEMAFLMLQGCRQRCSPAKLVARHPAPEVPVNALLSKHSGENSVTQLLDAGYRTIKLKVGGENPAAEIERVRRISKQVAGRALLRLDANQAFSLREATTFTRAVKDYPVEYFEEPLQNPAELEMFARQTGFPLALDESILKYDLNFLEKIPGVRAFVYKPGIYGGVQDVLEIARAARQRGTSLVVSSAFQTGLSVYFLANLAAALDQKPIAMGLGTLNYFREPLFEGLPKPANGKIALNHGQFPEIKPNRKYLQLVKQY